MSYSNEVLLGQHLINLTPHEVRVLGPDGAVAVVLPPSGQVARVAMARDSFESQALPGVQCHRSVPGEVEGLPAPAFRCQDCWHLSDTDMVCSVHGCQYGLAPVHYIVSALVRAACPGRYDVVSPGPLVRSADGQPTGCSGLEFNARVHRGR